MAKAVGHHGILALGQWQCYKATRDVTGKLFQCTAEINEGGSVVLQIPSGSCGGPAVWGGEGQGEEINTFEHSAGALPMKVNVKVLIVQSCPTLAGPRTVACP